MGSILKPELYLILAKKSPWKKILQNNYKNNIFYRKCRWCSFKFKLTIIKTTSHKKAYFI